MALSIGDFVVVEGRHYPIMHGPDSTPDHQRFVTVADLGNEFTFDGTKWHVKLDSSMRRHWDGSIGVKPRWLATGYDKLLLLCVIVLAFGLGMFTLAVLDGLVGLGWQFLALVLLAAAALFGWWIRPWWEPQEPWWSGPAPTVDNDDDVHDR